MKQGFVAEILRATGALRAGDPAGATDIVRAALSAGGLVPDGTPVRSRATPGGFAGGEPAGSGPAGRLRDGAAGSGAREASDLRRHGLRKSLSETVRILSAGRKSLRPGAKGRRARPAAIPIPEGASFGELDYSCAAGERRYRLYVPAKAAEGVRGLIVMLHGCTQDPEDFAAGTSMNVVAEEQGLLVAYPAQSQRDNAMACWNWFRPGDQMREAGEPAIIAGLTESIRAEYGVSRDRVFVAGLSAGGAMAAIMGETYPDLYAAIGVHSGLAFGSARDVASAFSAMQGQESAPGGKSDGRGNGSGTPPRVIVFHGTGDSTVHPVNAERIVARQAGDPSRILRFDHAAKDGRRGYTRLLLPDGEGTPLLECWMIDGGEHAWSGGHPSGSYTDPRGPSASAEMVRFFLAGRAA